MLHLLQRFCSQLLKLFLHFTSSFLLSYLQNKEHAWHGYMYALGYAVFQFLGGLVESHAAYILSTGAYKVQSALVAALFKKVLVL